MKVCINMLEEHKKTKESGSKEKDDVCAVKGRAGALTVHRREWDILKVEWRMVFAIPPSRVPSAPRDWPDCDDRRTYDSPRIVFGLVPPTPDP